MSLPAPSTRPVSIGPVTIGGGAPLAVIAGPCVIETSDHVQRLAEALAEIARRVDIPLIFKCSFDKANRMSVDSYRGPGLEQGLPILAAVRRSVGCPVLTDVHEIAHCVPAAEAVDILQIPAFLCRQTDLITAAAKTGRPLNIKKGQFVAPQDMAHIAEKAARAGNTRLTLTERGESFGYGNLVADMRGIPLMQRTGYPVVFDATHSVQMPGSANGGKTSGGMRDMAPVLARAAVAAGADAVFMEVHDDPDRAPSDGPNMLRLDTVEELWRTLKRIRAAIETA